jgi:hypothetical protein
MYIQGSPCSDTDKLKAGVMNMKIIINKPEIRSYDGICRLEAEIEFPEVTKTVYFSFPEEYMDGLCDENADAFLAAALLYCMRRGLDIECRAPVSRPMLYWLEERMVKQLADNCEHYSRINIKAQPFDKIFDNKGYVGLCWSGGVDSFYSLAENMDAPKGFRPTHLLNINAGVYEEPDIAGKFARSSEKTIRDAEYFGLKALNIDTNLHETFPDLYISVFGFRLGAALLAVQKSFRTGMISSSYELKYLGIDENVEGYYEFLTQSSLSNRNITLRVPGVEISRIEKLRRLADFPPAHDRLFVCVKEEGRNCCRCDKCARVISALDALGRLEEFGGSFDLSYVHDNIDDIWGKVIHGAKESVYCAEPVGMYRRSGRSFSPKALLRAKMLDAAQKAAANHEKEIRKNLT